ncbi:MAG: sodium:solute symporter family transporter, partial [Planctomycetaceae bacterium]
MIYEFNLGAVIVFALIVLFTLGLSWYLGSRARSASGFFAAGGGIPWFVNGVAFAGDYLSAASFLGICGMIAFYGYDGFLYSIGYLAGWVVALFVIAEPLKRMGKYTLADALDSRFKSRGIKFAVAISTLAVSIFYLIPQMVGAGVLVTPLFGLPHWVGVVMVGTIVVLIVVFAGMVSTTWVQFLKGSLLVFFSAVLTVLILYRGFEVPLQAPRNATIGPLPMPPSGKIEQATWGEQLGGVGFYLSAGPTKVLPVGDHWYVWFRAFNSAENHVWRVDRVSGSSNQVMLSPARLVSETSDGRKLLNGQPIGAHFGDRQLESVGSISNLPGDQRKTGPVGPMEFFRILQDSTIETWESEIIQ